MYVIDTNILLKIVLKEERSEECEMFLSKIQSGELSAIICDFSIDSALIIMENNGADSFVLSRFLNSLMYYKGLTIYEISLKDRIVACNHIRNYKLDYDDSIILQTLFSNQITELVSFDSDFDEIREIKRLEPHTIISPV